MLRAKRQRWHCSPCEEVVDLHQHLSTLLGHGRAAPSKLLHQARHHCVALLPSRILSNWSPDRDCLLCVTGCKNNVLAGILQNRISLNDQNESLSVFKLMKMIVKWTAKQLFVTSQVDETDEHKTTFCHSPPSSQKRSGRRRAAYWARPHTASRMSTTTKPTIEICRETR